MVWYVLFFSVTCNMRNCETCFVSESHLTCFNSINFEKFMKTLVAVYSNAYRSTKQSREIILRVCT